MCIAHCTIQRWTKLWVVAHSEVSPLDSFMGYCKKESKWLLDDQAIVKYSLNEFTLSRTTTKKHDRVLQLDFPSLSLSVQLCFDSQTKMDHYYQLLYKVSGKITRGAPLIRLGPLASVCVYLNIRSYCFCFKLSFFRPSVDFPPTNRMLC